MRRRRPGPSLARLRQRPGHPNPVSGHGGKAKAPIEGGGYGVTRVDPDEHPIRPRGGKSREEHTESMTTCAPSPYPR